MYGNGRRSARCALLAACVFCTAVTAFARTVAEPGNGATQGSPASLSSGATAGGTVKPAAGASGVFVGLDWSASFLVPFSPGPPGITLDGVALTLTAGLKSFTPFVPVRGRLGIAWFPGRDFRILPGIEIPVFESIRRSGARGFGVYLFADAIVAPWGARILSGRLKLGVLLPVTLAGGLCVAAGVDTAGNPVAALIMMSGGYVGR